MGGATRLMTFIATRFPPIRLSLILLHRRLSTLSATPLRLNTLSSPAQTKPSIPQLNDNTYAIHSAVKQPQQNHHPWPEWTQFLNSLSNWQGFSAPEDHKISNEDALVAFEQLTDELVTAASTCIAFARARPDLLRLLSRRDIEAVVSNGTPFLFKSVLTTSRRMRAFLGTNVSKVPQVVQASTIDLMKYIITYAGTATVSSKRNGFYNRELVDSSVRNLLLELGRICSEAPTSRERHVRKPFGQNIEMKKGDWICPKCNFMNFARRLKCLKCEEPRLIPGRSWKCPQCKFYNFGRNRGCLKCEFRRPNTQPFEMKRGDWMCTKCNFPNYARNKTCKECDDPIPWEQNGEWRCPQCNFFNNKTDRICSRCECRRPRRPITLKMVESLLNIQTAAISEGPRMSFCSNDNVRLEEGSEVKETEPLDMSEEAKAKKS